jgi:hypothetical protein
MYSGSRTKSASCAEVLGYIYSHVQLYQDDTVSCLFIVFFGNPSGNLPETFLKPSGAPEELPKDVQRCPEGIPKPPGFQLKKTPVFNYSESNINIK